MLHAWSPTEAYKIDLSNIKGFSNSNRQTISAPEADSEVECVATCGRISKFALLVARTPRPKRETLP